MCAHVRARTRMRYAGAAQPHAFVNIMRALNAIRGKYKCDGAIPREDPGACIISATLSIQLVHLSDTRNLI